MNDPQPDVPHSVSEIQMGMAKGNIAALPCTFFCTILLAALFLPVFFAASDNVLPTCEDPSLALWLRICPVITIFWNPMAYTFAIVASWMGSKICFKIGNLVHSLNVLATIAAQVYGVILYLDTTDEKCAGPGSTNPRDVVLYVLVGHALFAALTMCFVSMILLCVCFGLGTRGADFVESPELGQLLAASTSPQAPA